MTTPAPLTADEIAALESRLKEACAEHIKWGHPGSAAVVLHDRELAALLAACERAAALDAFLVEHGEALAEQVACPARGLTRDLNCKRCKLQEAFHALRKGKR